MNCEVTIKDKVYVVEDAWCISKAVDIATSQYYEDTGELIYNYDERIRVTPEGDDSMYFDKETKDWEYCDKQGGNNFEN